MPGSWSDYLELRTGDAPPPSPEAGDVRVYADSGGALRAVQSDGTDAPIGGGGGGATALQLATVPVSAAELLSLDAGNGGSTSVPLIAEVPGKQIVLVSAVYAYTPGSVPFDPSDDSADLIADHGDGTLGSGTGGFEFPNPAGTNPLWPLIPQVVVATNNDVAQSLAAPSGFAVQLDNWGTQLTNGDGSIIVTLLYYTVDAP